MTLVLTAYRSDCTAKERRQNGALRRCGDRQKCINAKYFCDGHLNCVTDNVPQDEVDCELQTSTSKSDMKAFNDEDGDSKNGLNIVSWTLILICGGVGILLAGILTLKCKGRKSQQEQQNEPNDFELCPQQPMSLAELDRSRHLRAHAEDNVYVPLNHPHPQQQPQQQQQQPTESEPPSYESLFPPSTQSQQQQEQSQA